jgi:hypothetical protein
MTLSDRPRSSSDGGRRVGGNGSGGFERWPGGDGWVTEIGPLGSDG